MSTYRISDECRYLLDAILPTFICNRIADIRGSVEKIIVREQGNSSETKVYRLSLSIQDFLEQNQFGHSVDYVFIIDKKGEDLKKSGSLRAYEELYLKY